MLHQRTLAFACAATATAALGFAAAPSQAISLGELIRDNGTLTIGGKEFSNFSFQAACLPGPCPANDSVSNPFSPVNPFDITVGTVTLDGNFGLKFNDFWNAKPGYGIDNEIGYTVKVLDPSQWIHDIHLGIDPIIGAGTVTVTETVFNSGGTAIGQLLATNESLSTITDWANLTEDVQVANVVKDIQLLGTNGQTAHFTTMTQTFSDPVPEPSAVGGLLAFGSVGVGFMLKRGKKNKDVVL